MNVRLISIAIALAVSAVAVSPVADAQSRKKGPNDKVAKKLYRWVDADGKIQYSDALPAEAIDRARQEISLSALTRKDVGRQLTEEERAEEQARAAEEAQIVRSEQQRIKAQEAILTSFQNAEDLKRAYDERRNMLTDNLVSLEASLSAQRNSLMDVLNVAGESELQRKPVAKKHAESIAALRVEMIKQESQLAASKIEAEAIEQEMQQMMKLFAERKPGR